MRLKLCGSFIAIHKLCLYFMWLEQLLMRELKMQYKACRRKKRLLIILKHFPQVGSVQSLRRSAIVFIVFFSLLIRDLKPATERWLRRRSYLTFLSFFSTQEIIPFPKFLGIFFVSFLNLFHYPPPLFLPVFPVPLRAVSSAYGMSSFHSKEEEDCYSRSGIVLYGSICSRGGGSRKSVWGCEVLCEG